MKWTILIVLALGGSGAVADDVWRTPNPNRAWQTECGSCHVPFPPALLSRDNWHRLMQGLDKHFGSDASVDAATHDEIAAFLEENAATDLWGHSSDVLRITDTSWFLDKHRGAIRMFRKGRIKNLADCLACHKGSEIVNPD